MPSRVALALTTLSACMLAVLVALWLADSGAPQPSASASGWSGALRPPNARVPAFALRSADGRRISTAALRGRPAVFTFVYSHCRDSCPATVQTIRGALDRLGRDVPVLGVSVDPANDTVASARRFVSAQHMTGRMAFLLGARAQLARVWRAFGIAPQRDDEEHTSYIVLVDGAGRQRIGFPFSAQTPEGVAHDLARLVSRAA